MPQMPTHSTQGTMEATSDMGEVKLRQTPRYA